MWRKPLQHFCLESSRGKKTSSNFPNWPLAFSTWRRVSSPKSRWLPILKVNFSWNFSEISHHQIESHSAAFEEFLDFLQGTGEAGEQSMELVFDLSTITESWCLNSVAIVFLEAFSFDPSVVLDDRIGMVSFEISVNIHEIFLLVIAIVIQPTRNTSGKEGETYYRYCVMIFNCLLLIFQFSFLKSFDGSMNYCRMMVCTNAKFRVRYPRIPPGLLPKTELFRKFLLTKGNWQFQQVEVLVGMNEFDWLTCSDQCALCGFTERHRGYEGQGAEQDMER